MVKTARIQQQAANTNVSVELLHNPVVSVEQVNVNGHMMSVWTRMGKDRVSTDARARY